MEKPNLERIWETRIKIGLPQTVTIQQIIHTIRSKLYPMLLDLKTKKTIKWYCFLIHGSRRKDDPNLYFHIRFEPKSDINDKERVNGILPEYCEKGMTERCKDVEDVYSIEGIDKALLKNEEIEEVWRIIGEQSEWLMNMLNIHKDNVEIPIRQITRFMHFYLNMLGLGNQAILFLAPIFPF